MPAVILEVPTLSHIPAFVPFGVLYYTQDTGSVYIGTGSSDPPNVELVTSGGGTPGGFNGDIQYNNLGAFAGSAATVDAPGNISALTVNASTGFQVANTATTGNYLRGNGSNFVSSAIQSGDVFSGTGLARNTGACTELSGDVTTSGSNSASVVKVNGGTVPASATVVGTNSSRQIVDASSATLSNNTSGTASNLSGTPTLPNGTKGHSE
jgi:hypothetical protein